MDLLLNQIEFVFDQEKEQRLIQLRNISFKEIIKAIKSGVQTRVFVHPNQTKYYKQQICVVELYGYAYVVPFVKEGNKIYLKTIYPSRKAVKYLNQKEKETV